MGVNGEFPPDHHEAQKTAPQSITSKKAEGTDDAQLQQPTEFNMLARKHANDQHNLATSMTQSESHLEDMNTATSPNYSDFMVSDMPNLSMDDNDFATHQDAVQIAVSEQRTSECPPWAEPGSTVKYQTGFDVSATSTTPQDNHATDNIRNETCLDGINSAMSPNYTDLVLPDLPEISIEDEGLHLDHYSFQHVGMERDSSEVSLCWSADNTLYQPVEPHIFTSLFSSAQSNLYGTLSKSFDLGSEARSTFQEGGQNLSSLPNAEGPTTSAPPRPVSVTLEENNKTFSPSKTTVGGPPRIDWGSKQKSLVRELVDYASIASDVPPGERRRHWQSVSTEVCTVFGLAQTHSSEYCILVQLVHLYKQNLLPLWPMISEESLEDPTTLHPVLFLVAVSIGAMYLDDHNASVFGTMMHQCLQNCLITSFVEQEIANPSDTIWLAQARNTIQVVALYFGQGQGLAYAQHLGAVLVSQARRMKLFRRSGLEESSAQRTPEENVSAWIWAETRRRVAFGIFRADVFLSLLLNCPPSLSPDELEISLPYPDSLWLSIGKLSPEELWGTLERERRRRNDTPFCDLIRIISDCDEVLLNMETRNYELLLFGLQEQVWKFSHDPDMFQRLIGRPWQEEESNNTYASSLDAEINHVFDSGTFHHSWDRLQVSHREMKDLVRDRRRLSKTLEKWNQSFNASRRFRSGFNRDRGSILSSLLLFHIYHLQLNASLDVLHHIADGLCNKVTIDYKRLRMAIRWAQTPQARRATYHASKIWSLLDNEAKMNPMKKARYTVLSFMGLYHASVVLWTRFGACKDPDSEQLSFVGGINTVPPVDGSQYSGRAYEILTSIVFLYSKLKCMSWDAFAESVHRLSYQQFPRDHS